MKPAPCPVCKRVIEREWSEDDYDYVFPYHDNVPPCRSVCIASRRTYATACVIAEERAALHDFPRGE